MSAQLTANEIAQQLGKGYGPTDEQRRIIEADPTRSHLVVAGAGSGKTETMSDRVVWLIANGYAKPAEVLGLTFTRKAAGELGERIRDQVLRLQTVLQPQQSQSPLVQRLQAEVPEVSTYNAFAAAIYRDHALLIGREPDAVVISEATAWQLAWQVVRSAQSPDLDQAEMSMSQVTAAVLTLARALQDNVADPAEVAAFGIECADWLTAPVEAATGGRAVTLNNYRNRLALLPVLAELAIEFQAAKRARGFIEFSDQIAFALEIITSHPEVAESYRQRYRAVLLDEYQDTSVVQTRFFRQLFAGTPVMAVGDPDQSIYGFRGASASNLLDFPQHFSAGEPFTLSRSWRNPTRVLRAANAIAMPLQQPEQFGGFRKPELDAPESAGTGSVAISVLPTIEAEAAAVADWMADRMLAAQPEDTTKPTGAVLFRAKRHMALFAQALRERGLSVHVVGVAGVLDEPVIVDLIAALRVVADPSANSELIRLLSGARWQIGAKDIVALAGIATRMLRHDSRRRPLDAEVSQAIRNSYEVDETASLVDALDAITRNDLPSGWLGELEPAALERMKQAGEELLSIRNRAGLPLADLVSFTASVLLLDVEARANESALFAENSLEAFAELVESFGTVADTVSLNAFLDWLEQVDRQEDVAARQEPVEPGTVQLLTVHGAKGLEWDYVAIPRWSDSELPKSPRSNLAWLEFGQLPWKFRGDANHLPQLSLIDETEPKAVDDHINAFKDEVKQHQLREERRIAYVAVTRPKNELLLTSSVWSSGVRPLKLSPLLVEIAGALGLTEQAVAPEGAEALGVPEPEARLWPRPDGLGVRADRVRQAADAVRQSSAEIAEPALRQRLELLLAEDHAAETAELPVRIPASRVKEYLDNPQAVLAELGRPLPERPYRQTRLGTLFHSWVEQRSIGALDERIDSDDAEHDSGPTLDAAALAQLQATFAASPWAALKPIDVEREIHLPLAGQVFICKIDAVYAIDAESPADPGRPVGARYQVVDWKTGAGPKDERDLLLKQSQLALYRLAYAKHLGIDPAEIDAVFYFVAEDRVVRPERLYSEDEFVSDWSSALSSLGSDSGSVDT